MYTENLLTKLIGTIVVIIGIVFFVNVLFGKYSIFNYFQQKSKIETLTKERNAKLKVKQKLLIELNLLKKSSIVNLDIVEKETIKKLNRIPSGYFIVIQ